MRKVFLLAVMVLFSTVLHAQPRGEEQMVAIAAGQLQQAGSGIKVVKQSSAYSVFTGRDGGFVVVSRDESCPKVLGYSSSAVDMQNLPDGLKWWLEAVEALSEMRTDADAAPSTAGQMEEVPNFMTSTWGQSVPYNMVCPVDNVGKRYSNEEWMHIIYRELKARRPVLYTGMEAQEYDADGNMYYREGHSFIFSGIDADGRLYVNWGWNGLADGFFDFSDLAPAGIQNHAETYHFNYDQEMVYGVTPDSSPSPMAPKYSDFGTLSPLYTIEMAGNSSLYIDVGFVIRYYLPFIGTINLVFDRNDGKRFVTVLFDNSSIEPIIPAKGFTLTSPSFRLNGLQEGTYKVYIASKATNDTQFQPLRCEGGPIYYELINSSGNITLSGAKPMDYHDYTSGISTPVMSSDGQLQRIYTLGGQQAPSIRRSNIYIMNGKKIVVK